MIGYLRGNLLQIGTKSCILGTSAGVGYELFMGETPLKNLPELQSELEFYVYTLVREDALMLFGFLSWEQRQAFEILLSVPKLGPRTSLAILDFFEPGDLAQKIADNDVHSLTRVPGIGTKSAQRMVLDLKDKFRVGMFGATSRPQAQPSAKNDTLAALAALGYSQAEILPVVSELFQNEPEQDVGAAVRLALKELSKQKS